MWLYVCDVGLMFWSRLFHNLGDCSSGAVGCFWMRGGLVGDGFVVEMKVYQRARLRPAPSSHEGRCLKESSLAEMRDRAQRRHL